MLLGLDTSHHSTFTQQQMSDMVKSKQLYFNFLKATEGATLQDQKFIDYWTICRKAGLACGAYHFLRPLSDATAQANNFLTQYNKVSRSGVLPPVVDIEWATSSSGPEQWGQIAPAQRLLQIKTFLNAVEASLAIKPIIYTAPVFWRDLIQPACSAADTQLFSTHKLWVVDLKNTGALPQPWQTTGAAFVQYHFGEQATTPELYDRLDQNRFPGDLKAFFNTMAPNFTLMRGFPFSYMVKGVQERLVALGKLAANGADGLFGPNTETAVKAFQQENGLYDNGVVDAQTWNKLW